MWKNIFGKMDRGRGLLKMGRSGNNRQYEIAKRTIVVHFMEMLFTFCITMKLLLVMYGMDLPDNGGEQEYCEKEESEKWPHFKNHIGKCKKHLGKSG